MNTKHFDVTFIVKEHEARTTQVLLEYKAKLVEKTKHHMG